MLEILLVFSLNGELEDISERIFTSYEECEEFVNAVADDGTGTDVVNSDYSFRFLSIDGLMFEGQCIEMNDWFLKRSNLESII